VNNCKLTAASLLAALLPLAARANVTPNPLFSDHMVLQQGVAVPVWGTADAGEQVTVTLGTAKQSATAGADGKWMVRLPVQKAAGTAMEMTIAGKNTITVKDVLIGEVWVASGQSNMQMPVASSGPYGGLTNAAEAIAGADLPQFRMFTLPSSTNAVPQTTMRGSWIISSPTTVPTWSAVGFLFGSNLQRALKIPVGVVTTAFGASAAEAWISREALAADPLNKPMLDQFDASMAFFKTNPTATYAEAPKRPTPINKARPAATARPGDPSRDQHEPTVLFNAMINPIIPYAMKGAFWYQGESICYGDAGVSNYGHVIASLITDWRTRWGEGDFPFYIVEIPGQQNLSNNPRIREQQAAVMKMVPNVQLAGIIDTGEARNVHPRNKAPLGDRLVRIARATVYGEKIEYSGPVYDSMKVVGSTIVVKFTHLGVAPADKTGLVAKGGDLKWFQIAGDDQKFVTAKATIEGDTVIVSSPDVKAPVAVRYAWDNFPDGCNLYNSADIPASPFRTDTWKYPLVGVVE
jgi:sialate O-acetylesterase